MLEAARAKLAAVTPRQQIGLHIFIDYEQSVFIGKTSNCEKLARNKVAAVSSAEFVKQHNFSVITCDMLVISR